MNPTDDPLKDQYWREEEARNHKRVMERLAAASAPSVSKEEITVPTLKDARLAKNLTQKEMGDLLGVNPGHYSHLESGHRPLDKHVDKLTELFGEFTIPERVTTRRIGGRGSKTPPVEADASVIQEAVASVALDKDPRAQTYSMDDPMQDYVTKANESYAEAQHRRAKERLDQLPQVEVQPDPPDDYPVSLAETVEGGVHTYTTYGELKQNNPELAAIVAVHYQPGKAYIMEGVEDGGSLSPLEETEEEVDDRDTAARRARRVQQEVDETSDEAIALILQQAKARDYRDELERSTFPQSGERMKGSTAYEVVRQWLKNRIPLVYYDDKTEWWLDWAAANFLADPEVMTKLISKDQLDDQVRVATMIAREGTEAETVHHVTEFIRNRARAYRGISNKIADTLFVLANEIDSGGWHRHG